VGYDNEVERRILGQYTDWYEFIVLFRNQIVTSIIFGLYQIHFRIHFHHLYRIVLKHNGNWQLKRLCYKSEKHYTPAITWHDFIANSHYRSKHFPYGNYHFSFSFYAHRAKLKGLAHKLLFYIVLISSLSHHHQNEFLFSSHRFYPFLEKL